jgi:hypothetical protein
MDYSVDNSKPPDFSMPIALEDREGVENDLLIRKKYQVSSGLSV